MAAAAGPSSQLFNRIGEVVAPRSSSLPPPQLSFFHCHTIDFERMGPLDDDLLDDLMDYNEDMFYDAFREEGSSNNLDWQVVLLSLVMLLTLWSQIYYESTSHLYGCMYVLIICALRSSNFDVLNEYSSFFLQCDHSHDFRTKKGTAEPTRKKTIWIGDSGASSHFSPIKSDFVEYWEFLKKILVAMANKNTLTFIHGVGTVIIKHKNSDGETQFVKLSPVMYQPDCLYRLLSYGQLTEYGHTTRRYGDPR